MRMNKMTKNIISLAIAIVLLGGLAGVYIWQSRKAEKEAAEATPEPGPVYTTVSLIEKTELDIESVTFTNDEGTMTIAGEIVKEEGRETVRWFLAEYPEVRLNQSTARDITRGLYSLIAANTVIENVENPSEYGITPDVATAVCRYRDGSTATLHIGRMTPDKGYTYFMLEGDSTLYLLYDIYGKRYSYGINDLIDKNVPAINGDQTQYIYIKEKDKPAIEFGFTGTEQEKQDMLAQYNAVYITMLQPYPGRDIYYSNFNDNILKTFEGFLPGDLVELYPDDLSVYGLDDPSLEIWMTDIENDLHYLFGDDVGEDMIYCKQADTPHVFLAEKSYLTRFYDINVFSFTERFISLVDILDCNGIKITSSDKIGVDYDIVLEHITLPPKTEGAEGEAIINPYINGQLVQEKAFKTFYQRLISLSYDQEIELYTPAASEKPLLSVTFTQTDKPSVNVRFYEHDANFYAIKRDDNPIQFVCNKQSVDIMLTAMVDLLAGRLDRD